MVHHRNGTVMSEGYALCYSEKRTKYDIVHHSNGTVSYRQNRTFHFLPELSVGKESDNFTTPNPLFWVSQIRG